MTLQWGRGWEGDGETNISSQLDVTNPKKEREGNERKVKGKDCNSLSVVLKHGMPPTFSTFPRLILANTPLTTTHHYKTPLYSTYVGSILGGQVEKHPRAFLPQTRNHRKFSIF